MLLNVNTYANSVIESSFAFMNFIEVLMNVYLPYSFNCWRKWMYILRKWTAKGVIRKSPVLWPIYALVLNQSEARYLWVSDVCSEIFDCFSETSFCSPEDSRLTMGTSNINDIKNDVKAKEIIPKKIKHLDHLQVVFFSNYIYLCLRLSYLLLLGRY